MTISKTSISKTERQFQISELINRNGRLQVSQLCEIFDIGEATARRDLNELFEKGIIKRVHGGAIQIQFASPEKPIIKREFEQKAEKQLIGKAASALIRDGETIFLGSGTTVIELARNLIDHKITVISNSLPVINIMINRPIIQLIALGGLMRESELSFIGNITEQALTEVRVDKVFMGTRAISLTQGMTNDYLPETLTDRAILRIGRETIIVADHSKCGSVSAAFLAPLEAMQIFVTDSKTDIQFIKTLEDKGINVIIA